MTFTLQQTSLTASGATTGGVTYLAPVLPALSAAGTLLVATMQTAHGGVPFKCSSLATAPGNVAAAAAGTGGAFAAGTYFWVITATTANGETNRSAEASATVALNGSASLTWSALPSFVTGVNVYRGVSSGGENALVASLGRVTSYTDTGDPGTTRSPPSANTAGHPNTAPGWVFCALAAAGSALQTEIWCYPNNPGGLSGATFTNAAGAAARGTVQEWSTTKHWQVMDLFPAGAAATGTGQPSATTSGTPGAGDLAIALLADHFTASPAGQSWTAPAGWTLIQSQANSLATPWAAYYKISGGAGAVTVTGNYSTSVNQDARAAVIVAFSEADSVAGRVGVAAINANTYTDQASFGFPATHKGSIKEFDHFVGRVMAGSAGSIYQNPEGSSVTSIPGDMQDLADIGAQFLWSLKPKRALTGSALAAQQAVVDANITFVKQAGFSGWVACIHNEYNLGGAQGPFGNDTNKPSGDPYGTGNTDATAKANWLAHWANYQPILTAHGIPAVTTPSMSSAPSVSTWHPPAGTVSQCMVHQYADSGVTQHHYMDASPAAGVPSIQDICDGIRNPDNSAASHPPIPLGSGELGRSGGGNFPPQAPTWAEVVTFSHKSAGDTAVYAGHGVRDLFRARLAAGKQNTMLLWFTNNNGSGNWIHTPGANGEDQTGIQKEFRAWVDNLTVSVVTGGNPAITTTSPLPSGQAGVPYTAPLTAAGGTTPYTWSVTTGALPAGLSLDAVTGQITGSPSAAGTTSPGFTVTDAAALTGSATLSITITAVTALTVPPQALPGGTAGAAYSTMLTARGGAPPYTWALTGAPSAYLSQAAMGVPDNAAAEAQWKTSMARPLGARRHYMGPSDFSIPASFAADIANGTRICLSLKPALSPVSAADLAAMDTMLSTLKNQGADLIVCLWHEPFIYTGLSAAAYAAAVQYYAATVRKHYPLAFVTSMSSVANNSENSYYPGDAYIDVVATDYYQVNRWAGRSLDLAATLADSAAPRKPFGIWEFNNSEVNFLAGDNATFDSGIGNWTNTGGCTIARSTVWAHDGTGSLALTATGTSNATAGHCLATDYNVHGIPCAPGDSVTVTGWFRAATVARNVSAGIEWFSSAGTSLSTVFGTAVADSATADTQATATLTAPASAAFYRLRIQVASPGAAGEIHYFDSPNIMSAGELATLRTDFYGYIQSYMTARPAAGKINSDVLFFNDTGTGGLSTVVTSGADPRVTLLRSLADALSALPAGLSLTAANGTISGAPAAAGMASFTVQATDSAAAAASRTLSITVATIAFAITTTTADLPPGTLGTAYTGEIDTAGGVLPVSWQVISGQLPPGLTLAIAAPADPNLDDEAGANITDEAGANITQEA